MKYTGIFLNKLSFLFSRRVYYRQNRTVVSYISYFVLFFALILAFAFLKWHFDSPAGHANQEHDGRREQLPEQRRVRDGGLRARAPRRLLQLLRRALHRHHILHQAEAEANVLCIQPHTTMHSYKHNR